MFVSIGFAPLCCYNHDQPSISLSTCFNFLLTISNLVSGLAGKGSYGSVYKARDLKTSEIVAVKVISLTEGVLKACPLT